MPESRLSTRISLRWPPNPPFENTDTLVFSVSGWYVDLRVQPSKNNNNNATNAKDKIDWAIAGRRIVQNEEDNDNEDAHRISFTHTLDSRNTFASTDCGTFTKLPNGDDLERGRMPHPDRPGNPLAEYEEVWRELTPLSLGLDPCSGLGAGGMVSWILESETDLEGHAGTCVQQRFQRQQEAEKEGRSRPVQIVKTFLGRIGGVFVALRQGLECIRAPAASTTSTTSGSVGWVPQRGGPVSARREEWDAASSSWREKYVLGPDGWDMPSLVTGLEGEGRGCWRVPGEKVVVKGEDYVVRAFEELA